MPASRAASSRERPMASRRSRIMPPKICRQARRLTDEGAGDIKRCILINSLLLRCAPCQEGYGALIKLQGEYVLRGGVYQSPELKGVNPEDYPDIHKLAILADVAPYSREYNLFRQKVGKEAQGNTELQIEYETILNRVKQTRDSVIRMENRRFTAPVEEVEDTVRVGLTSGRHPEGIPRSF